MRNQIKKLSLESQNILNNTYVELANPKPHFRLPDYKSYLKQRKLLSYYSFCPFVFEDLLDLSIAYLNNQKRADRKSLLNHTIKYLVELKVNYGQYPKWGFHLKGHPMESSIAKLFQLGDIIILGNVPHVNSELQKKLSWKILKALSMFRWGSKELEIICSWTVICEEAVKLILEAPQNLKVTKEWIFSNEDNSCVSPYRINHVARMIDIDPTYVVKPEILLNDMMVLNDIERKEIQSIINSEKIIERVDKQRAKLKDTYMIISGKELDDFDDVFYKEFQDFIENPSKRIPQDSTVIPYTVTDMDVYINKRHYEYRYYFDGYIFRPKYSRPIKMKRTQTLDKRVFVPDFDAGFKELSNRTDYYQAKTMMWGIALSALPDRKKKTMLGKWLTDETLLSLIRIVRVLNKPEWLRW